MLLGLMQSIPQQTVTIPIIGLGVDRTRSHEPMFVLDLGKVVGADNQFTIKFQESNDDITYNDIPDVDLPGGGQPAVIDQNNDGRMIRRRYQGTKSFLRVVVTTIQGTHPSLPMSAQVVLGYGKVSDELSLANLSLLYRISSLAKALKLSIRELLAVKALAEIDPFATTDATLRFVEQVGVIRASGFSILYGTGCKGFVYTTNDRNMFQLLEELIEEVGGRKRLFPKFMPQGLEALP